MPWWLIVDDNEMFREVLQASLLRHFVGIDIGQAESAEEALAKISNDPPILIFVDIQLPGENGLQLTRRIKDRYPQTLVVACTNFDSDAYRQAAYRAGADHFVSKATLSIKELTRWVHSHG